MRFRLLPGLGQTGSSPLEHGRANDVVPVHIDLEAPPLCREPPPRGGGAHQAPHPLGGCLAPSAGLPGHAGVQLWHQRVLCGLHRRSALAGDQGALQLGQPRPSLNLAPGRAALRLRHLAAPVEAPARAGHDLDEVPALAAELRAGPLDTADHILNVPEAVRCHKQHQRLARAGVPVNHLSHVLVLLGPQLQRRQRQPRSEQLAGGLPEDVLQVPARPRVAAHVAQQRLRALRGPQAAQQQVCQHLVVEVAGPRRRQRAGGVAGVAVEDLGAALGRAGRGTPAGEQLQQLCGGEDGIHLAHVRVAVELEAGAGGLQLPIEARLHADVVHVAGLQRSRPGARRGAAGQGQAAEPPGALQGEEGAPPSPPAVQPPPVVGLQQAGLDQPPLHLLRGPQRRHVLQHGGVHNLLGVTRPTGTVRGEERKHCALVAAAGPP
mmetsp:Transcript_22773/g.59437  ORF Transcript_22773/g.59437 Transcript_22773/m.59437 type:complete len:435 (-) Transcript_22773:558-1862(-)